jgi:riboflavin kinase/FMN adenylyltransferase
VLVTSLNARILQPTAIALGNFDGIHRGHLQVLQPILTNSLAHPTVVSFNPHPREFFSGQTLKLLTPLPEKVKCLEALGVKQLVLLPFDRQIADLTPEEFVEKILFQQLKASHIVVGEDFRFGKNRAGTVRDLSAIAQKFGIAVDIIHSYKEDLDERISSSLIRQALERGEIQRANLMLGRPYSLQGIVVRGQQLGRKIGFPTANLQLPTNKFIPRYGVYAVSVVVEEEQKRLKGVMNIGCRPTVNGSGETIEVHLFDCSADLYKQTLVVELNKFLREEQKFASLEALKSQIAIDCQIAKEC